MTGAMWLRNLEAYGIQVALLILAGALLARLFRIEQPRAALLYWRTVLAVCLLLPLCQPWQTSSVAPAIVTGVAPVGDPALHSSVAPAAPVAHGWPSVERLVWIAISIGIALRAGWLALGAWVLGTIRRGAAALDPVPEPIARAQEQIGALAQMYVSDKIAGPITFGLRRPVIVFPPGIASLDASVQHAIACHELLHVRRRDWVFQVVEESIRSAFWFHPPMWWLIGRIQLTREQVVDQEVVRLLDSRERYVEALLAVAIAKSPGFLTPAPAFFRRSLLKKRVAQILQESTMTTRRLICSLGVSAGALALAATLAVRSFPLEAQGQPRTAGTEPVEIVKGGEHLLHGELPEYPRRAIDQKVEGDVLLDLAVDDHGEVSDARVLSGPDELRKVALEAVLNWHYSPAALRSSSTQATLRFNLAAANTEFKGVAYMAEMKGENGELTPGQRVERQMAELQRAMADPNATPSQLDEYKKKMAGAKEQMEHIRAEREAAGGSTGYAVISKDGVQLENRQGPLRLAAFRTERVSTDAASEVLKRSGLKIGDTITEDSLKGLRAAASAVDEHFHIIVHEHGQGEVEVVLVSSE